MLGWVIIFFIIVIIVVVFGFGGIVGVVIGIV